MKKNLTPGIGKKYCINHIKIACLYFHDLAFFYVKNSLLTKHMKLSSSVYVGQHEGGSLVHWRSKCRRRASQGALSSLTAYCCLCNLKFKLPEESIFNNGSNGEIGRENSRKLSYAYQLVLVWSEPGLALQCLPPGKIGSL